MTASRVMARVEKGLAQCHRALERDAGASPVLKATVDELARKFGKNRAAIEAEDARSREAIVELEQAADSARYAAEADLGAEEVTRLTIIDTHDWLCVFKQTGQMLRADGG